MIELQKQTSKTRAPQHADGAVRRWQVISVIANFYKRLGSRFSPRKEQTVEKTCTCISCDECGGTGTVWFSFSGNYLGNHRCDDLDELETCQECRGRGILEMCDSCQELEEAALFDDDDLL